MQDQNHYRVLDVPRDADREEIRQAYIRLAKRWHPDRNPGSDQAVAEFRKITEAWDVLGDPDKRYLYDQQWEEGRETLHEPIVPPYLYDEAEEERPRRRRRGIRIYESPDNEAQKGCLLLLVVLTAVWWIPYVARALAWVLSRLQGE